MRPFLEKVEGGITVVDLCSNLGGMMILLACLGLLARSAGPADARHAAASGTKPIDFPLTNMPAKNVVVLCLRHGRLYDLMEMERRAVTALARRAQTGAPVRGVQFSGHGVEVTAELLPTAEGFDFTYTLDPGGGIPLADSRGVRDTLLRLRQEYPAGKFFVDVWVWPEDECFRAARSILEWLHAAGIEAGWSPRSEGVYEGIAYTIGEGAEDYRSFTSQ